MSIDNRDPDQIDSELSKEEPNLPCNILFLFKRWKQKFIELENRVSALELG